MPYGHNLWLQCSAGSCILGRSMTMQSCRKQPASSAADISHTASLITHSAQPAKLGWYFAHARVWHSTPPSQTHAQELESLIV
jgi:hypothetical protein